MPENECWKLEMSCGLGVSVVALIEAIFDLCHLLLRK